MLRHPCHSLIFVVKEVNKSAHGPNLVVLLIKSPENALKTERLARITTKFGP
jgi:hypothetical protein